MTQEITVKADATDQGRVLVRTSSGPLFYASPGAARDLARDLVDAAKVAERIAATAFVQSAHASADKPVTIAPDERPASKKQRVTGAQRLQEMLQNGYLFEGEQILGWYPADSKEPLASLTIRADGQLVDDQGNAYENPSKAASRLLPNIPASTNGWFPWKVCRDYSAVSLNAIMTAMKDGRPPRRRTQWEDSDISQERYKPVSG